MLHRWVRSARTYLEGLGGLLALELSEEARGIRGLDVLRRSVDHHKQ